MSTTDRDRLNQFLKGISVIDIDPTILEDPKFSELWEHVKINREALITAILEFAESERRVAALDIKRQIDQCGPKHSGVRKPLKTYITNNYLRVSAQ